MYVKDCLDVMDLAEGPCVKLNVWIFVETLCYEGFTLNVLFILWMTKHHKFEIVVI